MKAIHRIMEFLNVKGIKPARFERVCGLSNGYLSKQITANSDTGEGVILKILENYQDINPIWLLTGTGEMLKSEVSTNSNNVNASINELEQLQRQLLDKEKLIKYLELATEQMQARLYQYESETLHSKKRAS